MPDVIKVVNEGSKNSETMLQSNAVSQASSVQSGPACKTHSDDATPGDHSSPKNVSHSNVSQRSGSNTNKSHSNVTTTKPHSHVSTTESHSSVVGVVEPHSTSVLDEAVNYINDHLRVFRTIPWVVGGVGAILVIKYSGMVSVNYY